MFMLKMFSTDEYTPRIAVKAGMWRGILFVLVIMGLCVGASRTEAKEIPADKANFVFYAPGLGKGIFERHFDQYSYMDIGKWTTRLPVAIVLHRVLSGAEYRPGRPNIKEFMSGMTKDTLTNFGPRLTHRANIGVVPYRTFSLEKLSCVGFAAEYSGGKIISGFYCDSEPLSEGKIKFVLDGLGIKGRGTLPKPIPADMQKVPLTGSWKGVYESISGALLYAAKGTSGQLEIIIPSGDESCSGTWNLSSGSYGTSDPPNGTWSVSCTNGLIASGNFISPDRGKGTGTGEDAEGRAVSFSYGF